MCKWFACVTKGDGKLIYIDAEGRKKAAKGKLMCSEGINTIDEPDSHSQICAHFGLRCDGVNKYECRPLDRQVLVDQLNTKDDRLSVARKLRRLDYQPLAPKELTLGPIIHPLKSTPRKAVTREEMRWLVQWDSVRASVWKSRVRSVWASVWHSVKESVKGSVWCSVRSSVWDSVWESVGQSVRGSVWRSVRASVGESMEEDVWDSVCYSGECSVKDRVWESMGDSVGVYAGSFFTLNKWEGIKHKKGEYPFQPCVNLWKRGLVPSFDGMTWRIHSGPKAKIIKEISQSDLRLTV